MSVRSTVGMVWPSGMRTSWQCVPATPSVGASGHQVLVAALTFSWSEGSTGWVGLSASPLRRCTIWRSAG